VHIIGKGGGEDKVRRVPHPTQPVPSLRCGLGVGSLPSAAVRLRRWFLAGAAAVALVGGLTVAREWYLSRAPRLGAIEVTPAVAQLSVRVVGIARMAADVNNRGTDISVSLLGGRFFERYRASIAWTPGIAVRS